MPNQGPWSKYVHRNNNMLANLKHNASALFWYTQRHHRSKGHGPWLTNWGYCAQPPRPKSHGKQASPPFGGCTVHAQGLKSWVGGFIRQEFCLGALEPRIIHCHARPPRRGVMSAGYLTQSLTVRPRDHRPKTPNYGPCLD